VVLKPKTFEIKLHMLGHMKE